MAVMSANEIEPHDALCAWPEFPSVGVTRLTVMNVDWSSSTEGRSRLADGERSFGDAEPKSSNDCSERFPDEPSRLGLAKPGVSSETEQVKASIRVIGGDCEGFAVPGKIFIGDCSP